MSKPASASPVTMPPHCRCCDSPQTRLRGSKWGAHTGRVYHYYVCDRCRFLFVDPCAGAEVYDENYYKGRGADPFVNYEAEAADYRSTARVLEFKDLKTQAERFFEAKPDRSAAPVKWLDFGCGAGGFLRFLQDEDALAVGGTRRKLDVFGHDVGAWANRLASEGFCIVDLERLSTEPADSYDVISMVEVLEHVAYPAQALALASRLLKPGGLLLLTTGNLSNPVATVRGLAYRYCIPEIHISLFNPHCLASLYEKVGLQPIHVNYDGVVKFKVMKGLFDRRWRAAARLAFKMPFAARLVDWAYGVSAMPCATKPPRVR